MFWDFTKILILIFSFSSLCCKSQRLRNEVHTETPIETSQDRSEISVSSYHLASNGYFEKDSDPAKAPRSDIQEDLSYGENKFLGIKNTKIIEADFKKGKLVSLSDSQMVPQACYSFALDLTKPSLVLSTAKYIANRLDSLNIPFTVSAAGQLCVNSEGKIYSFDNRSIYSLALESNTNFFNYLQSKGLVQKEGLHLGAYSEIAGILMKAEKTNPVPLKRREAYSVVEIPAYRGKRVDKTAMPTSVKKVSEKDLAVKTEYRAVESKPDSLYFSDEIGDGQFFLEDYFKPKLNNSEDGITFPQKKGKSTTVDLGDENTVEISLLGQGAYGGVYRLVFRNEEGDVVLETAMKRSEKREIDSGSGRKSSSGSGFDSESSSGFKSTNSGFSDSGSTEDDFFSSLSGREMSEGSKAFQDEITVLNNLRGENIPNLIQVHAHFLEKGESPMLFLEVLPKVLRNESVPFEVKHYAQTSKALLSMHNAGWAHMDIKLENIGLDSAGNAKVFDLGLATKLKEGAPNNSGTNSWMAPEKESAKMDRFLKKRSDGLYVYTSDPTRLYDPALGDVYSLAMCIYRKKNGIDTADMALKKEMDSNFKILRTSNDPLDKLLVKALEEDPAKRINMKDFSQGLNAF